MAPTADDCPYDELDPPMVELCRAINGMEGLTTVGSCGGHDGDGELPADSWRVSFMLDLTADLAPTPQAWLSCELVAWLIYDAGWRSGVVDLLAHARPPFLNDPARMLTFSIYGTRAGEHGMEPDEVAGFLREILAEVGR